MYSYVVIKIDDGKAESIIEIYFYTFFLQRIDSFFDEKGVG